jgi:hypothetical protein
MKIQGMPERFWLVLKPSSVVELSDICFACDFGGLMDRVRGGLHEYEIAGIFADEAEAREATMQLLGKFPVRVEDACFAEVVVNVMVQPRVEALTARELGEAAVEAVRSAIRLAEERGHQHRLGDRAALGMSEVVALQNQIVVYG